MSLQHPEQISAPVELGTEERLDRLIPSFGMSRAAVIRKALVLGLAMLERRNVENHNGNGFIQRNGCKFVGCPFGESQGGYCRQHYRQWWMHEGDVTRMRAIR